MKGGILVFLGACSYGVLSTVVALAYRAGFVLNDVIGSQLVVGALMLWLVVLARRRQWRAPTLRTALPTMIAGITTGATTLLYYATLQFVSPALAVVLFLQFTWMGIVLDGVLQRQWPALPRLLAVVVILVGSALAVNLPELGLGGLNWRGTALGLAAALCNTLRIYASGRIGVKLDPMLRAALMVSGGAIFSSLIVPPTFLLHADSLWNVLSSYGLFLAFFGSVFSVLMFSLGAPLISTGLASVLSAMQLPITILLSVLVLKLPVTPLQLTGVAAILLGIAIAGVPARKHGKSS